MGFDVLTMGRVGVDLYPDQSGVSLADVRSFSKFLGGTATNVAVASARYGHRAGVITKVGDDAFGMYIRSALRGFDVDDRYVGTDPDHKTPVVFCEIHPPDHFPIVFYRDPKAPDMTLHVDELDLPAIRESRIFWTTGTGLSDEPSRTATLGALQARNKAGITIHDLDYRPVLWRDPGEAGRWQREALQNATVAIGNLEECAVAVGTGDAGAMGERLLDLGVSTAVVKMGPDGVVAYTEDAEYRAAPVTVEVVNGLGAGDAFGGGICHGLLSGWDWDRTVRFANAAGALVAGRLACADAMPEEHEVMELLE